jgi:hypothetical protein
MKRCRCGARCTGPTITTGWQQIPLAPILLSLPVFRRRDAEPAVTSGLCLYGKPTACGPTLKSRYPEIGRRFSGLAAQTDSSPGNGRRGCISPTIRNLCYCQASGNLALCSGTFLRAPAAPASGRKTSPRSIRLRLWQRWVAPRHRKSCDSVHGNRRMV